MKKWYKAFIGCSEIKAWTIGIIVMSLPMYAFTKMLLESISALGVFVIMIVMYGLSWYIYVTQIIEFIQENKSK